MLCEKFAGGIVFKAAMGDWFRSTSCLTRNLILDRLPTIKCWYGNGVQFFCVFLIITYRLIK